jgi:hypothetical protein
MNRYLIAVVVDGDPRRTRDVTIQGRSPWQAGWLYRQINPDAWVVAVRRVVRIEHEAQVFADPTRRYFPTQIQGGDRRGKLYEGFLRGLGNGAIPSGGRLVPTSLVINAAGNPKKNIFATIANKLSTSDQGGVFIGTPKGSGRLPGVYRRSRGKLFAYFVHVDSTRYEPRFPMERVGMDTAKRLFPSELNKALDRALNSAR